MQHPDYTAQHSATDKVPNIYKGNRLITKYHITYLMYSAHSEPFLKSVALLRSSTPEKGIMCVHGQLSYLPYLT